MLPFDVLCAPDIRAMVNADPRMALQIVARAYDDHHAGKTVNPHSQFLRFPDNALNRIIALPASLGEGAGVAGIKWIASFPGNATRGLARASAVLVLNDLQTGYPFALLESSVISATRTAASAVLAAGWMNRQVKRASSLAVIGAGVIARSIVDVFAADGWRFDDLRVHDLSLAHAEQGAHHAQRLWPQADARAVSLTHALHADLVVFATTAGQPYVPASMAFRPGQILLNISLRDLAPEHILAADNLFDDVDHCLKAATSPHLAEQACGHRDFVTGTLAQLMRGEITLNRSKPLIFSPFGMGILDRALGHELYRRAKAAGRTHPIPDFFGTEGQP